MAAVISIFVGEADRDATIGEGPKLLDQPVVKFPRHLRPRKASMASRPDINSAGFRHWLSGVQASATLVGSRLFQPSSASLTFSIAVCSVRVGRWSEHDGHYSIG